MHSIHCFRKSRCLADVVTETATILTDHDFSQPTITGMKSANAVFVADWNTMPPSLQNNSHCIIQASTINFLFQQAFYRLSFNHSNTFLTALITTLGFVSLFSTGLFQCTMTSTDARVQTDIHSFSSVLNHSGFSVCVK